MDNINSHKPEDTTDVHKNTEKDISCEELKDVSGINVWKQAQKVLEQQALEELCIFNQNKTRKLEAESSPNLEDGNRKDTQILDINQYIKRQEQLHRDKQHKIATQKKAGCENVARKELKHLKKETRHSSSPNAQEKSEHDIPDTHSNNGSEYFPSDHDDADADYEPEEEYVTEKVNTRRKRKTNGIVKVIDDGLLSSYKKRLREYYTRMEGEIQAGDNHGNGACDDIEIVDKLRIDSKTWGNLYSYQQEGVEWLYGLHKKSCGGLLGDEMGLGKTVQVIAFLYALNYSRISQNSCRYVGLGPTIIVCPTTVLHQWVQHFHEWAPEFRVAVLHQSGSFVGSKLQLINEIFKHQGILITSYQGMLKYKEPLVELNWHYVILDEGHYIRNASSKVTVAVKRFRTPHRIILTGSPMQNNLQELWSLFDFVMPGMLGTSQLFTTYFAQPIVQGGYANATQTQESLALSMATALKNLITPHLLRRFKDEVQEKICLPHKSEQVLFCSMTNEQRDLYKSFLLSDEISTLLGKTGKFWFAENSTRASVLVAITTLRKICNHPDIYLREEDSNVNVTKTNDDEQYGHYKRSGKMIVVSALLKIWKRQGHRVLLFTQSRLMIGLLEKFLGEYGYNFLKMDGSTSISSRQSLINKFNQDTTFDVFLLTTRVGGLGINLTGADRVIIYDPDWNPATDIQARERAWRIGQDKQVTIYRLLSAGTIEEKIYQRQVWKQLLSNRILLDPSSRKFFKTSDLHDLFSFQEQSDAKNPETANIFKDSRVSIERKLAKRDKLKRNEHKDKLPQDVNFSDDKIKQMRLLAQQLAKSIGKENKTDDVQKKKRKIGHELEDEIEKTRKQNERNCMKKLTPQQLLQYNRQKQCNFEDKSINQIDGFEADVSFSKAMKITETTSQIYHKMKSNKLDYDVAQKRYDSVTGVVDLNETSPPKKRKVEEKVTVDTSGTIDGQKIDGLLKREKKKVDKRRKHNSGNARQDDYVLEKLFAKKGVQTALKHDVIVDSKHKEQVNRFRIHTDVQMQTDLALRAIGKAKFMNRTM